jgi:hypothetical protein
MIKKIHTAPRDRYLNDQAEFKLKQQLQQSVEDDNRGNVEPAATTEAEETEAVETEEKGTTKKAKGSKKAGA